ncbi:MAG TPA: TetR/AcrR family transcriptional regulator [Solirubrobacterales bacterium]|nr:TetR/AcrR family transcriptional regulator [Solirubrobacterales bacterium]
MGVLSVGDRDRLLTAMADCCAKRGYAETTIAAVTDRAGVGRTSFDSLFDSKEDCAFAALNKIVSETLAAVSTAPAADSESEHRVLQIRAILELMSAQPSFAHLVYIEARQGGTGRMRDTYQSAAHVLSLMMERLGGSGEPVPARAARAALGGAEAVVRRELVGGKTGALPRLLPDFVYAALVPFVGQREALRQSRLAKKLLAEEG